MTEGELTELVIAECGRRGLVAHHCRDSRRCEGTPGVPDVIIANRNGVVFAELKSADGETSALQDLWAYHLHMVQEKSYALGGWYAVRYQLWRPEDWHSGEIQRFLEALAASA